MFATYGFNPAYTVEVSPEFPLDGVWAEPMHAFDRDGRHLAEPLTRWGAPVVVGVLPHQRGTWVGNFAAGGLGGETAVAACPRGTDICVVVDGLAYLVGVDHPEDDAVLLLDQVKQLVGVASPPRLVLVNDLGAVALGESGIAWKTPRLALDGLWLDRVLPDGLVLTADQVEGGTNTIMLDVATGEQTSGARFRDCWPPDALA